MRLQNISILFLLFIIALSSCKTPGLVQSSTIKKRPAKFLLQKMEEKRYNYDWLAAKAKVKFESKDQNVSFTVNLRIKHDSIIWLKVQKISVEGLRVRMSPDRIEVLNRQDNQYIVETFASVQSKMPIPFGFAEIENLLAGNPFMQEGLDFQVSTDSNNYVLEADLNTNKNTASTKGKVKLWLDEEYRLVRLSAKIDESTLDANFADFQAVNEKYFVAFEKDIVLNSPESGEIRFKINFNKIDLNEEQDLKFEIPEHYEQIISGNKIPKK
jgi:hypothetical protein